VFEPIFEENAIEARFFAVFVPPVFFRRRPVLVVRSSPFPAVGKTRTPKHSETPYASLAKTLGASLA
jgi:hypothetical protein